MGGGWGGGRRERERERERERQMDDLGEDDMNDPDLLAELGELMDEAGTDTGAAAPHAKVSVTNELAQLQASMGVLPELISV